jgi:hypothetical protein
MQSGRPRWGRAPPRRNVMKTVSKLALALALVVGLSLAAQAAEEKEVMLKGEVACAHCTLKLADAKECQDALQVTAGNGTKTNYYFVQNEILEKFGHNCEGKRAVMVTGKVMEKEGKKWLKASKIEEVKG